MLKPNLFYLLRAYFTLGIEGEETQTTESEIETETEEIVENDTETVTETEEVAEVEEKPVKEGRANAAIREQRERAQAEREARIRAEAERDALRASQQPVRDHAFEAEEAKLRNPDTSDLEKWQINANRELRTQREQNNRVLFEARNIRDETAFRNYANERNPGYFKAYQKRVEEKFNEALKAGEPQSRTVLFKLMLADDLLEGRIKSAKQVQTGETKKPVPRGQSPGVRSDVQRGGSTARQKLYARLEGKQI